MPSHFLPSIPPSEELTQDVVGPPLKRVRKFPWAEWTACLLAGAAYLLFNEQYDLPVLPLLAILCPLVPTLLREAMLDREHLLSPHNIALFTFYLAIFGEPINVSVYGTRGLISRHLYFSDAALTQAILLTSFGYLCYCIGFALTRRQTKAAAPCWRATHGATIWLAIAFVVIGVVALMVYHGGFAEYFEYLASPASRRRFDELRGSTVAGAIGIWLKPFLGFGWAALWCVFIDRFRRTVPPAVLAVATLAFMPLLILAVASYNRASMLIPLIGVLSVFSSRVRQIPAYIVAVIIGLLLAVAVFWGSYRSHGEPLSAVLTADGLARLVNQTDKGAEFASILVAGTALDRNVDTTLYFGKTLIYSILSPIPVLGKQFRDENGQAVYNRLIYGNVDVSDQVIPFYFELFVNFHLPGIALGYAILGYIVCRFHAAFNRGIMESAVQGYMLFSLSFWFSAVVAHSIGVVAQMCVFVFPAPLIVLIAMRTLGRRDASATALSMVGSTADPPLHAYSSYHS